MRLAPTEDGLFSNGDGQRVLGTPVTAEFLNSLLHELQNVLSHAGLEADEKTNNQLITAINSVLKDTSPQYALSVDQLNNSVGDFDKQLKLVKSYYSSTNTGTQKSNVACWVDGLATQPNGVNIFGDANRPNGRWLLLTERLWILDAGVRNDGSLSDDKLATLCSANLNMPIYLPSGHYNFSNLPGVMPEFIADGKVTFSNKQLPMKTGVYAGNRDIAIVAGVVRYYAANGANPAGWYFLVDKGEAHNPVLLGPITASGNSSIHLKVNLTDFGLNPAEWTPAGASVTPDETLALEGVCVGGSVGMDKIEIKGSVNGPAPFRVQYLNDAWQTTNNNYSLEWKDGGTATAYLRVTRTAGKRKIGASYVNQFDVINRAINVGVANGPYLSMHASETLLSDGNQCVDIVFYDMKGTRMQNPVNGMCCSIIDYAAPNRPLVWSSWAPLYGNLWVLGIYTRK